MNNVLYRAVHAAVTRFTARLRPSTEERKQMATQYPDDPQKKANESTRIMVEYPFHQRTDFTKEMHGQLDDNNRVLDQMAVKLQELRIQVVSLRRKLDRSHDSTEATWEDIKAGFRKEHGELLEAVRNVHRWTSGKTVS